MGQRERWKWEWLLTWKISFYLDQMLDSSIRSIAAQHLHHSSWPPDYPQTHKQPISRSYDPENPHQKGEKWLQPFNWRGSPDHTSSHSVIEPAGRRRGRFRFHGRNAVTWFSGTCLGCHWRCRNDQSQEEGKPSHRVIWRGFRGLVYPEPAAGGHWLRGIDWGSQRTNCMRLYNRWWN